MRFTVNKRVAGQSTEQDWVQHGLWSGGQETEDRSLFECGEGEKCKAGNRNGVTRVSVSNTPRLTSVSIAENDTPTHTSTDGDGDRWSERERFISHFTGVAGKRY